MENKSNDPTNLRPDGSRIIDAPMVTIDIPKFIKQIKSEATWQKNDRNAITIFKTDGMNIVLVALHKNAVMQEHATDGIISLQVLEGKLNFQTSDESQLLRPGEMIALHSGLAHSVHAIEETVFLLTLTNPSGI